MDVVVGLAQRNQSVAGAQRFGQRVGDAFPHERPKVADDLVHAFRAQHVREFLGRRVDALHPALGLVREGLFDGLQFGVGHRQLPAVERRPSEDEVLASDLDPLLDPLDSLEPHQLGRARRVLHAGREAAFASRSGVADARDAGAELHVGKPRRIGDLGDAVDTRAVDVAEGVMAEHVAERADAQLALEHFRPRFADPRDVLYVVVEILHRTNIRSFPRFRIPRLRFPPSGRVSRANLQDGFPRGVFSG